MKYYAADCAPRRRPGSGLTNAGCNGSDVGLEETIEDAANDPTLHSVSNSWGFGGEAEWGAADPFLIAAENSLTIAAAAGTTLLLLDRRLGHVPVRLPVRQPARRRRRRHEHVLDERTPATWSTSHDVERRRQLVLERLRPAVVADRRRRRGQRAVPGPRRSRTSRRSPTRTPASASSRRRTPPAARRPARSAARASRRRCMNGLQAVTQNFVDAQTYPGAEAADRLRRRRCSTSSATAPNYDELLPRRRVRQHREPDERARRRRRDEGLGRGDRLGRARLVQLLASATRCARRDEPERAGRRSRRHFAWTCAKTPSNSTERGFSCPSASTCYAVGARVGRARRGTASSSPAGAWGAVNTFFKSHRRRRRPGSRRTATCSRSRARARAHLHRGRRRRPRAAHDRRRRRRGPTSRRRPATTSRSRRSRARRARSATRSATAATR